MRGLTTLLGLLLVALFTIISSCSKDSNNDTGSTVCRITAPSNGQEIVKGQTVVVSVETDDIAIDIIEVRYYINGVGKSAISSFPYNYQWNTTDESLGVHTIKVSAINYSGIVGSDEISVTLTDGQLPVNDEPVAAFSANVVSGEAPLNVSFSDETTNSPTSWFWDFGDGNSSTDQNPSNTYNTEGIYSVLLIAYNSYGSDTLIKTSYINVGSSSGGWIPCPDTPTVTDADGNVYNTVQIGSQCWMRENLRVGSRIDGSMNQTDNGTVEKFCYDDDPSNCEVFGGLYQWGEVMNYSEEEGSPGICPQGWHVPSDQDWKYLEIHLGMTEAQANLSDWRGSDQGEQMKTTTGWDNDGNGTNSSGFTGLPGGFRSGEDTQFNLLGQGGLWWTSTTFSETQSWYRSLNIYGKQVQRTYNYRGSGITVRCVKD